MGDVFADQVSLFPLVIVLLNVACPSQGCSLEAQLFFGDVCARSLPICSANEPLLIPFTQPPSSPLGDKLHPTKIHLPALSPEGQN